MLIRIQLFPLILIRSRIQLFASMRIWSGSCSSSKLCEFVTSGLQTFQNPISSLHTSFMSVDSPPWLHFEPLKLLNFELSADPDPAFHSNADLDSTLKNNAYPCGSGFATFLKSQLKSVSGRVTDGTRSVTLKTTSFKEVDMCTDMWTDNKKSVTL